MKIVAVNKKAYHDFQVLEKYESGIVLTGEEVRAVREGRVNLKGSFAKIMNNELWLLNGYIKSKEADRTRKLLIHKRELKRLLGKLQEKGLSLVPLKMYFKNNVAKIELGLCRGLKLYDKREKIKKRDTDRQIRNSKRKILSNI
jgi:SsrA-binding protein